jgi:hypothetical protein
MVVRSCEQPSELVTEISVNMSEGLGDRAPPPFRVAVRQHFGQQIVRHTHLHTWRADLKRLFGL